MYAFLGTFDVAVWFCDLSASFLQFPFEWVSQHCEGMGASFSMNKELAAKFEQLKVMNETADSDGTHVLETLLNTQKNLELSGMN
jgi:hypothetical protein